MQLWTLCMAFDLQLCAKDYLLPYSLQHLVVLDEVNEGIK